MPLNFKAPLPPQLAKLVSFNKKNKRLLDLSTQYLGEHSIERIELLCKDFPSNIESLLLGNNIFLEKNSANLEFLLKKYRSRYTPYI